MKDEQGSAVNGGVTECDQGAPNTRTRTTFGFPHLGAGGVSQSALLLFSKSLKAQIRCYRSAGLSSQCDCFWGGIKMLAMSVLKGPVDPYYVCVIMCCTTLFAPVLASPSFLHFLVTLLPTVNLSQLPQAVTLSHCLLCFLPPILLVYFSKLT